MTTSIQRIKVNGDISGQLGKIAQAAEEIEKVRTTLIRDYESRSNAMGQSKDLDVFRAKHQEAMKDIDSLSKQVAEYSNKLSSAESNYKKAQENAIFLAKMIPK